jgi:hypothetical protein
VVVWGGRRRRRRGVGCKLEKYCILENCKFKGNVR